jgi:Tol biopolymer transport system component
MNLNPGTRLGRYEIKSLIGAGGMGEVYLAEDTELGRLVALKILPADVAASGQRMQRFIQEAKAASALNDQHIITVFDIGEADGARFISTEYVRGETLRARIARERLMLNESFEIGVQIAAALAAAHEAGIAHRDIKPENIMLRPDGLVKVLDFGLAKLTESGQAGATTDTEAPTRALVHTAPGVVMGTYAYMSPEQARGKETDTRTDIWSFGVVLYEMVTGRSPFVGETANDSVAAILKTELPPLATYAPEAPAELQRIVRKCLQKNRDERYQTTKDLLLDLKTLKRELEIAEGLAYASGLHATSPHASMTGAPNSVVGASVNAGSALSNATARASVAAATLDQQTRETHGTNDAHGATRRRSLVVPAIVAALVIAALGFGIYFFAGRHKAVARFAKLRFARLTTTGRVKEAAISPDGKYVVYVNDEGGKQSLWLKQIATAQNVQIVTPSDALLAAPVFSPDGNYVCYLQSVDGGVTHTLYQVAVLGGASRKLIYDVDNRVAFSPDGKRIAFIRNTSDESTVMIANADGTSEQRLAAHKQSESFFYLAWSPDAKVIACAVSRGTNNKALVAVASEGGAEKAIGAQRWQSISSPAWLPDGSALVLTAADKSDQSQVWLVSYPTGEARQVTNDLNGYHGGSLTADASALVVLHSDLQANIWIAPNGRADDARRVTSGTGKADGAAGLAWTPDNRLIYTLSAGGGADIWAMDSSGGNQKQLTSAAGANSYPTVTPDGRYIIFLAQRAGALALWRMDADGGNARQLVAGEISFQSSASPDGKWIVYTARAADSDRANLWKIAIDGGAPVRLTDLNASLPSVSPDGKQIAFRVVTDDPAAAASPRSLEVIPFDGGQAAKVSELPSMPYRVLQWMPDGRAIAYLDKRGGVSNIWVVSTTGGQPRQLTHFTSDGVFYFAWSRDGKSLALSRGEQTTDAVLVSEDR